MLRSNKSKQNEIEFISIEELVPEDYLLRKVDQYIDFSFILDKETITRHVWEESKEKVRENRVSKSGKFLTKREKKR